MERLCKSFLGLLCLLLLLCQTALAANLSKLVILHTNDTHGFDIKNEKDGINGLAEVAQLKKDLIAYAGLCKKGAVMDKQSIGYVDEETVENFLKEKLNGVIGEEYAVPQGRVTIKK